jgi:hypothetical protein
MKYCPNCGAELPDDANFCVRCGKSQDAPPQETVRTPGGGRRETCEIVAVAAGEKWSPVFPGDYILFRAQGEGPQGVYTVLESARLKAGLSDYYQANRHNKLHAKAVDELTAALTGAGWERAGKGEAWFSLRFHRRAD